MTAHQAQAVTLSGTLYENDGATAVTTGKTISVGIGTSSPSVQNTTSDGSGNFSFTLSTSTAGATWTARTSAAGDNDTWNGVTYGNGIFVAVASTTDRVMTSPDGITWTARSAAGDNDAWQAVTYGNGTFVAVAYGASGDHVMTSTDGITWTARSAAGDNDKWYDVTYGNGLFVAVGQGASGDHVMTSPDGTTWTARSAAGDNDTWNSITYGNGLFVAVGQGASGDHVMTSPDGTTWTARTAAGDNDTWQSVTYGNGIYVAVGTATDRVMTSPDGTTWTTRTAAGSDAWWSVTYTGVNFVAVSCGYNGSTCNTTSFSNRVMTSPDGTTWTYVSAAGNNDSWQCVTMGKSTLVAVGINASGDHVMTSAIFNQNTPITLFINGSDGKKATTLMQLSTADTTANVHLFADTVRMQQGTSGGSITPGGSSPFYDATNDPDILFDLNSATTTIGSVAQPSDLLIAANTMYVAPSNEYIYGDMQSLGSFTPNGYTTNFVGTAPQTKSAFTGANNLGVVSLNPASDGVTWTTRTAAGDNDTWNAVTHNGSNLFVAVGSGASGDHVMTSPDGTTWTARTAAGDNDTWTSVAYGTSTYVAVGSNTTDKVMTSPNGTTWTTRTAANTYAWSGVVYGGGQYVAVACGTGTTCNTSFGNRIMTSPYGNTWTARSGAGDNDSWGSVTYGTSTYVAVGSAEKRSLE